jgi:hypothetical protein
MKLRGISDGSQLDHSNASHIEIATAARTLTKIADTCTSLEALLSEFPTIWVEDGQKVDHVAPPVEEILRKVLEYAQFSDPMS